MATHLFQKPNESVWYVRVTVPVEVRSAFGGLTKLVKTTGTSNKSEAMDRRLPILALWKQQIQDAKDAKVAGREVWRPALAEGGLRLEKMLDESLLKAVKNPTNPSSGIFSEIAGTAVQPGREQELLLGMLRMVEKQGAIGFTERLRAAFAMDPAVPVERVKQEAAIMEDTVIHLTERSYGLSPSEVVEARSILQVPATYKPASPLTPTRLAAFRAFREKAGIALKTIDQQQSKLDKLSKYLREQGKPLDADLVGDWLESLSLSSKTKAQYLLAGSTFWLWAVKHDTRWREDYAGKDNPFRGQTLPKVRGKAKVEAARKAFTTEQIEQLYIVAKNEGNQTLCDLIALGAHTGCRIEELAQLRKESVVKVEGVLSFKIEDSKTAAGIREIPVHPALSATIERLTADSTDGFLLPSSAGNKYGIRSDPLSKAFGRLKTSQGFGRQHVFHSVRSMVVTLLLRGGVPGPTVANIVGHETGLVTFDIYDEGASPRQKLEAIEKLQYKFTG
jgi:integrase